MQVIHIRYPMDQSVLQRISPSVVAIGFFDGVHLGHQDLLKETRKLAAQLNVPPGIITFDPHPREVLGKSGPFQYVTPLKEKLRQMKHFGIDIAYVVHFDREFAALSPHDFIEEVLIPLHIKGAVVGFNYTFGHRAAGKADDLKRLSEGKLTVRIVKPVNVHAVTVSSTRLRKSLLQGDVQAAARFLGRPYRIDGIVEHGAGRGKQLGFPTANIRLTAPYIVPRTGVYAVKVEWKGRTYDGAMNIGFNPTFEDDRQAVSVEVYLLDFSEDLYGETVYVSFIRYLRPEQKFNSADELIEQMHEDVRQIRELAKQNECRE